MNTLAKEIFKPKLFSDQHERFEKEYPGFHQMIYDSMEEYKDKEIEDLKGQSVHSVIKAYIDQLEIKDKEIERLKGLVEQLYFKYYDDNFQEHLWQQFKTENNL